LNRIGFRVSAWARSPSIYTTNSAGQLVFKGANLCLTEIGETFEELDQYGNGAAERDVYLTATLPGAFNAVQLRGEIVDLNQGNSLSSSRFPNDCGCLSQMSDSPLDPGFPDTQCLQAAVNPLGILNVPYLPLAIVYEPPGNCSGARLTTEASVGAHVAVTQAASTSVNTISDSGFFWDVHHTDFTWESDSARSRSAQIVVTSGDSDFTTCGFEAGCDHCNNPLDPLPERPNSGPGFGDLFILLKNANLLFWDTADLSGWAFSPNDPPGKPSATILLTAQQIQSGQVPPGVSFTADQRSSLLALDPFTAVSANGLPTLPSRFVYLHTFGVGQGVRIEHTLTQNQAVEGGETFTQVTKNKSSSTSSGPDALFWQALTYGGNAAATKLAQLAVGAIGGPEMAGLASAIKINLPALYQDTTTTTVVTEFSKTQLTEKLADSAVTESFWLQDQHYGMSVQVYYDTFFGTFAFTTNALGTGITLDPGLAQLRSVVWLRDAAVTNAGLLLNVAFGDLTSSIQATLQQLGAISLRPASA
jgi:hypothetical protein